MYKLFILVAVSFLITNIVLFSVEQVSDSRSLLAQSENPQTVTIVFTGDVMLGRSVMQKMNNLSDFTYPFAYTAEFLSSADITFGNLENPFVSHCPPHNSGFTFCSPPKASDGLVYGGFDIMTLANNHTNNYGKDGISETVQTLTDRRILTTGIGKLEIIEKKGTTFGFLGFDYVTPNSANGDVDLVQHSDPLVDVLIVSPHWGVEYKDAANNYQRQKARELIAAGADVIVGHHPHWIQDWEIIDGKPVYFSLGNFIFDQMWSEETKKGLVIRLTFEGINIVKEERYYTYIKNIGQPQFVVN